MVGVSGRIRSFSCAILLLFSKEPYLGAALTAIIQGAPRSLRFQQKRAITRARIDDGQDIRHHNARVSHRRYHDRAGWDSQRLRPGGRGPRVLARTIDGAWPRATGG